MLTFLGQAPKIVPGLVAPSYMPASGKMPDFGALQRAGLPLAPIVEHGSWTTGQPDIMRWGLDPYRGIMGLGRLGRLGQLGRGRLGQVPIDPVHVAIFSVASLTGAATGAYHGYKRNNSIGWAIGWFLLGGLFPIVTIPVSLAQGYGKPRMKANRRRRRGTHIRL